MKVSGKFDVVLTPLEAYSHGVDGMHLNRMSLDKTYHGSLNAVGRGELLSAITSSIADCGYVAMEQVKGELDGKIGSFIVQHYGVMEHGQAKVFLEIVPNSGTGDLSGIKGTMEIDMFDDAPDKEHAYELTYFFE